MIRHTQHRNTSLYITDLNEERMNQLASQIKQSREKIDDYINVLNSKIGNVITSHINKIAVQHKEILDQKKLEIQKMQQRSQKLNDNEMGLCVRDLQAKLVSCKQDIERITNVLTIFRNVTEKYRIQLDIKNKQLDACKKRQKKLLKQLWVLEENIKDIYAFQFVTQITEPQVKTSASHRQLRNVNMQNRGRVSNDKKNHPRSLYTEQINKTREPRINSNVDQLHSVKSKLKINDKTNLYEKLNKRYVSSNTRRSNSQINKNSYANISPSQHTFSIYDDLRHSLRKIDRIDIQEPKYLKDQDKLIGKQEFGLIALNAPKIMKLIEKIVIQQYGQLKIIDENSIGLLNRLFENENAIKILQIILFTYSVSALQQIRENKQILKQQKDYAKPTSSQPPKEQTPGPVRLFAKKEIVESAIRKNFKYNYYKATTKANSKNKGN